MIDFVDVSQVRPDLGRIEKWVLRNAFDDDEKPYLPKVIKFLLSFILQSCCQIYCSFVFVLTSSIPS